MCGVCGFTGVRNHESLVRMATAIAHRGPDDAGYWESDDVSLGMRRLAIIDVESGQQPVFNEDGSVCVVFNGEVYNHAELRADLESKGHAFRSHHSDTEVLVHLYEEYGEEFLHRLNGMFAIAMWDNRHKRLILARDRAGIKPLYFTQSGGRVILRLRLSRCSRIQTSRESRASLRSTTTSVSSTCRRRGAHSRASNSFARARGSSSSEACSVARLGGHSSFEKTASLMRARRRRAFALSSKTRFGFACVRTFRSAHTSRAAWTARP